MTKKSMTSLAAASAMAAMTALTACTAGTSIEGEWVEPVPGMEHMTQGFALKKDGKASSINMATLQYETWKMEKDMLILTGKSIGNGMTIAMTDTLAIEKLTADSLIVKKGQLTLRYARKETQESVPMSELTPAQKQSFQTQGTLVLAHETRSFTPDGSQTSYWIVDKSGKLAEEYDKLTQGKKNGTPVHAELEVTDEGKSDEGFAKSYEGVYQVVKVNRLALIKSAD